MTHVMPLMFEDCGDPPTPILQKDATISKMKGIQIFFALPLVAGYRVRINDAVRLNRHEKPRE